MEPRGQLVSHSIHHMVSGDQTQVVELGDKYHSQLSHLTRHYFTLLCFYVLMHKMKIGCKITPEAHPSTVTSFDFVKRQNRSSCSQELLRF